LSDDLRGTSVIQDDHGCSKGEGFGDTKARFFVESWMDQYSCAGELGDEIWSADPTLETHAIPQAPLPRGSFQASLLRTIAEEAEPRFSVLNVAESPKREDRCLPWDQATDDEEITGTGS
jgi:hypothetical protein